jgi:DNA-directed RNA polymerase specialized sigma24 family protein
MQRNKVIFKAVAVVAVVWLGVWAVRAYAGTRKLTAERVNLAIVEADFADWSGNEAPPEAAEAARRDDELRRIAAMVNRLDFNEREKNRNNRTPEEFFRKLSSAEKNLFIDLTVRESMNRFMESLDAMPPVQRRKFVEQGLRDIQQGRTADDMARAEDMGADLLDRISQEGMRAYFEKSSADTKLDLAPLMEAVNETMQGLRGNEFGPPRHNQ